ncbi:MAG: hypothetical protein IMZ69_01775 [Spirochaetes bacterium]|nr:hypothetical protein [Spirochaetota bacterium]
MTVGELTAAILKVPGIRDVHRYQRPGKDRLYLSFREVEPVTGIYVDLLDGSVQFNRAELKWHLGCLWRHDPQGLGERSLSAVRELVDRYRRERIAELQRRTGGPHAITASCLPGMPHPVQADRGSR